MAVDLATKTTKELETIVANCQRLNRTGDARCLAASNMLQERRNGDYDLEKTVAAIRDHGQKGRFLSYRDIASASGLEWANVFRQINLHLDAVCAYSHGQGWPLLTAIVVSHQNLASGEMTAANRKGFLVAARGAGRDVDLEDIPFVKREQQRVFAWCQSEH
jgi:hypothetical protein